jgi:hypothetical protein
MAFMKGLFGDWFLRSMVLAVLLASAFPNIGRSGGWLHLDAVLDFGIALVFFLHGVGIPTEQLKAGLGNWRLHMLVQAFTFIVFPLLFLVFRAGTAAWLPPMLLLGFFYLAALPSTITSSVATTALARGNVPAAIFNATASSLLGIVLTPLLISLMSTDSGAALRPGATAASVPGPAIRANQEIHQHYRSQRRPAAGLRLIQRFSGRRPVAGLWRGDTAGDAGRCGILPGRGALAHDRGGAPARLSGGG